MALRVQVVIVAVLVVVLFLILNMVRERKMELKYVLAWLVADVALLIFTIFPDTMGAVSRFMGIQSAMNMIFFLGFAFSLIIIFTLTVALSRVTARVRKLAQKVALQEFENFEKSKQENAQSDNNE